MIGMDVCSGNFYTSKGVNERGSNKSISLHALLVVRSACYGNLHIVR